VEVRIVFGSVTIVVTRSVAAGVLCVALLGVLEMGGQLKLFAVLGASQTGRKISTVIRAVAVS
jgi:hypothetical protein